MLAITSGGDFARAQRRDRGDRGSTESAGGAVDRVRPLRHEAARRSRTRASCWSMANCSASWAKSAATGCASFELRGRSTVAELKLAVLDKLANLVPQYQRLAPFPAIERDLNLVVDEHVTWAEIASAVRDAAGPIPRRADLSRHLSRRRAAGRRQEEHPALDQAARSATARSPGEQADAIRDEIVSRCARDARRSTAPCDGEFRLPCEHAHGASRNHP